MQSRGRLVVLPLFAALVALACGRSPEGKPAAPRAYTVALVYCGWESWIGNDENPRLAADDPSRWPGALASIKAGLDRLDLAHTAPAGSRGLLISYADDVKLRVPLGPIGNLGSAALGSQGDYAGTLGVNLVQGVTRAVDELARAPAGNRLLVVVSDGTDTNAEQAAKLLPALKQRIVGLGIEVSSIVFKTAYSADGDLMTALTDQSVRAMARDDIAQDLVSVLQRVRGPEGPKT
jgi:hypothetical protein